MNPISWTPSKVIGLFVAAVLTSVMLSMGLVLLISYGDYAIGSRPHKYKQVSEPLEDLMRSYPPELRLSPLILDRSSPKQIFNGTIKNESAYQWGDIRIELVLSVKGLQIELQCADRIDKLQPHEAINFTITCHELQTQAWPAEVSYRAVVPTAYRLMAGKPDATNAVNTTTK